MKLIIGFWFGALFALALSSGKCDRKETILTETCRTSGFLIGKVWACTPEEKRTLESKNQEK